MEGKFRLSKQHNGGLAIFRNMSYRCGNKGRFLTIAEAATDSTSIARHSASVEEDLEMLHAKMHSMETNLN
ncbi:hypothetical protein Dsin_001113 [Dipteronia sinensis]|uniref:Uncharacterized protein n=1 Tax=Dipteronia sinensis TaxID=43782 RepID=A0AAE0B3P1_9ROSI|nr:hypothetical protein Dsin_001113 [Dipteronia sinensis]